MILVGLTGGVATGKSTVARFFKEHGASIIDADQLARDVVQPGKPAWRDIVRRYGKDVLLPGGAVDRKRLAAIVFAKPDRLKALNRIIHPRVAREQARRTRAILRTRPDAVVIYDVPLLFEAGVDERVDRIVVVTADRLTQLRRLAERNGLSHAEAVQRIRSQMPLREKIARADYVIDGTQPIQTVRRNVKQIYAELVELATGTRGKRGSSRPTRRSTGRTFRLGTATSPRAAPSSRDARSRRASRLAARRRAGSKAARGT